MSRGQLAFRGNANLRKECAVPATVVVGTQWGDEGKGKFTDLVAKEMELVVRYQGCLLYTSPSPRDS